MSCVRRRLFWEDRGEVVVSYECVGQRTLAEPASAPCRRPPTKRLEIPLGELLQTRACDPRQDSLNLNVLPGLRMNLSINACFG